MSLSALWWRRRLSLGGVLYAISAAVDTRHTLAGMAGDLWMEGNPLLRWAMQGMGPEAALLLLKTAMGAAVLLLAALGEHVLTRRPLPSSPARPRRRAPSTWIVYLPLYWAAAGQALAAACWALLAVLLPS